MRIGPLDARNHLGSHNHAYVTGEETNQKTERFPIAPKQALNSDMLEPGFYALCCREFKKKCESGAFQDVLTTVNL